MSAGLAPLSTDAKYFPVLDQLVFAQTDGIHQREAGPSLKLHTCFYAGRVTRLQPTFVHGREDVSVLFGLKWADVVGLIGFNLDAGKLRGGIGGNDARVVTELEKGFDPFLIVPLR
jgi:hypothetical protein